MVWNQSRRRMLMYLLMNSPEHICRINADLYLMGLSITKYFFFSIGDLLNPCGDKLFPYHGHDNHILEL
jgi:hypothetical protein